MSYILDALRKSEQQRPPGQVPDLFTLHGPQPPAPGRPLRAIAAVSLFLVAAAVGLGAWLGADRHDNVAGPARVETASAPQATASTATQSVGTDKSTPKDSAAPRSPVETRRPAAPKMSVPVSARPTHRPVDPQMPTAMAPPAPAATPSAAPEPLAVIAPAAPAVPTAVPAAAPPPVDTPAAAPLAPVAPTAAPALAEASSPEEAPPADGRVLDETDLPAAVRAQIPEIVVSGHVWSDDPSLRLITVNDRLLREGAEAAAGVRLQEITSKGAVFVFKGWRFRAGAARP